MVSEQKKTEEQDFRFWPREKWNESQKMKKGGGGWEGRKEGRKQTSKQTKNAEKACSQATLIVLGTFMS